MNKIVVSIIGLAVLIGCSGCANGPLRNWFRGAPCSVCNPPISQPIDGNLIGGCTNGACAEGSCGTGVCGGQAQHNGFLGKLFRPHQDSAVAAPPVLPANNYGSIAPEITTPSEFYGNTNVGRFENPPFDPYNQQ
jgi:hypothetical protein